MNVHFLAIILLLAGVTIGALSVLMLRASVIFLKRSYRRATESGRVANERKTHLVGKSLIADGIVIGFISSFACFVGITAGWCYISASLFGSWTFGVASVCIGAWSVILFYWGPRFFGNEPEKPHRKRM